MYPLEHIFFPPPSKRASLALHSLLWATGLDVKGLGHNCWKERTGQLLEGGFLYSPTPTLGADREQEVFWKCCLCGSERCCCNMVSSTSL